MTRYTSSQLRGNKFINTERQDLHAVIIWLKRAYPQVLYHFDYGADALLTGRQAAERKHLSWGRGWVELLIFELRNSHCGLAIDLKREDVTLFNRSGLYANEHLQEQADCMEKLRARGWWCGFTKGFDEAKDTIERYLRGEKMK